MVEKLAICRKCIEENDMQESELDYIKTVYANRYIEEFDIKIDYIDVYRCPVCNSLDIYIRELDTWLSEYYYLMPCFVELIIEIEEDLDIR